MRIINNSLLIDGEENKKTFYSVTIGVAFISLSIISNSETETSEKEARKQPKTQG